jgi:hypothetical protein
MTVLHSELVDVVCIGSGSAVFAAAIAAADAGLTVFVAEPRRRTSQTVPVADSVESWAALLQRHWGADEFDEPTDTFLSELTADLGPPVPSHAHGELPITSVESFDDVRADRRSAVPPFHGHELANWARECLNSPYGVVFSHLSPLAMSAVRRQDGTSIRAGAVAEIPPVRPTGMTLRQWLRDLAEERGVMIHGSTIQRLIFADDQPTDGQPVGAVLDTADGSCHVQASRGVLLGITGTVADDQLAVHPPSAPNDGRLSLVSRNASRFARLELLTAAQNVGACAPQGRPA